MNNNDMSIAGKYAYALFSIAKDPKTIYQDFLDLRAVIESKVIVKDILVFYNFQSMKAVSVINSLPFSDLFKSFLNTIFKNHRLHIFNEIFKAFERLLYKDVDRKIVESAAELSKQEKKEIEAFLPNSKISYELNANLIGGFLIKDETKMLDLSLLGFYREFRQKILSSNY